MWARQVPSISIAYNRKILISSVKQAKIFGPLQVSEDVLDAFPMSIGRLKTVPSKQIDSERDVRPCTIREVHALVEKGPFVPVPEAHLSRFRNRD